MIANFVCVIIRLLSFSTGSNTFICQPSISSCSSSFNISESTINIDDTSSNSDNNTVATIASSIILITVVIILVIVIALVLAVIMKRRYSKRNTTNKRKSLSIQDNGSSPLSNPIYQGRIIICIDTHFALLSNNIIFINNFFKLDGNPREQEEIIQTYEPIPYDNSNTITCSMSCESENIYSEASPPPVQSCTAMDSVSNGVYVSQCRIIVIEIISDQNVLIIRNIIIITDCCVYLQK